ncbi:hypothetical protein CAI21_13740 [Alkalilimnicola ehrlichii]|uniref:Copper chaperone PCu(A)C n=1 Tax=Alkalilimnicola ehrlichii TaxID=351052 RepID=A0A3E0WR01_9GAMM|nr:copper chaperone PCu(A)C [Alkalilimnicola ehrlichii]RFA27976.1 hypothetical protein CAI21_13740 [Alkalilimnicola ehrlichii]RFA34623.1 hypothetical protein CAL65_14765 [Alkalilimnicola ehrlichii]
MKQALRAFAGPLAIMMCVFSAPAASETLEASGAYARATPPGTENSAAYLVLRNTGEGDRRLVGAATPVAQTVELHTHLHEDGVMRMRQVEYIELPADSQVALEPGGLHIMLLGVREPLEAGQTVPLTLQFDGEEQLTVQAEVRHPSRSRHHHRHH